MIIQRAHKVELDPNDRQRTALLRHAGAARWAYNWGLKIQIDEYKTTGKSPNAIELHKRLNVLKDVPVSQGGIPWMRELSKCAPQQALRNLERARQSFFRNCKQGKSVRGFPKFKSRKKGIGSFTLDGSIKVSPDGKYIQLPRLYLIRLKEVGYLPTETKISSATVSERAGKWFVSVKTEQTVPDPPLPPTDPKVIGIDVGIKTLAVCSDGQVFENPKYLGQATRRLRRLQKSISRKVKGSNNRRKAKAKLARQHYRTACRRNDTIHKATSAIIKSADIFVLESLNVKGMMANHRLAKSVSDASFSEFHRQIIYKAGWAGKQVVRADRWFPSSKTCSGCGAINKNLELKDREWICQSCGVAHDRDFNASTNLRNYGLKQTTASAAGLACGDVVRPEFSVRKQKAASVKQELN